MQAASRLEAAGAEVRAVIAKARRLPYIAANPLGLKMDEKLLKLADIESLARPVAEKYRVQAIYLFGSYARGEADGSSDLDFLVFGGENFKRAMVLALAEELRIAFKKDVDVFEISELNKGSEFYKKVMREMVPVA